MMGFDGIVMPAHRRSKNGALLSPEQTDQSESGRRAAETDFYE
jgi:hypothetical protein